MSTTRISTAEPEELARAFSLLVKMRKSSKTKIFHRRLRCSDFETVFRQLSVRNTMYYNREQKEKDKALVQMHTDFSPVLQVLFHTALDCFRTPTDGLTAEQLLEECQQSSEDLCSMLLGYFGKHIVEPHRDLFEKATKMKVSNVPQQLQQHCSNRRRHLRRHPRRVPLATRVPFPRPAKVKAKARVERGKASNA